MGHDIDSVQLDLGPDPRTETLRRIQAKLIAQFGRIVRPPEKRRDPVWTLVQGVVGARTKTAVSNENTDRLLAKHGSWEKVAETPEGTLAKLLETATFPDLVAERLKACLQAIIARQGAVVLDHLSALPTEEAMAWLETLPGVARKVSAGVMNASDLNRRVVVIDSHHRRIVQRMGLVPSRADTRRAYDALMPILPSEWRAEDIDEHHLLVKRLGQTFCRPKRPDCRSCPVRSDCKQGSDIG